jgi:hypothetical protein
VITLATDGTTPTVITLTGTDSDNADANLIYSVESDGSFGGLGTLSQDSSVFTITPLAEGSATTTSSTLTFKVSDGINFGSGTTEFSLTFGPDWANTTESKLVASDAFQGDEFSEYALSLSSDGNYIIVGAGAHSGQNNIRGQAYIFNRSGSTWSEQAILTASNTGDNDRNGSSVDISSDGTYAITGAYREDGATNTISDGGAAYIYTRSGSTWTEQAILRASDAQASDQFGWSVSISGDGMYAIAGANSEDTGQTGTGAAYIFVRSGSTWTQQAKIQHSDRAQYDNFGYSVSISDDGSYAVIGAYYKNNQAGNAYIFSRSGSTWTQQAKLTASDAQASDRFGWSVNINDDGDYVIVGAYQEDTSAFNAGAAYIFSRSGSTWTQQAKIVSSDGEANDQFGWSVSLNSDATYAIVGALRSQYSVDDAGAAYIFTRDGTTWTQTRRLTASDPKSQDEFGHSVSISGDGGYAAVGAPQEDGGSGDPIFNAGAAYIYEAG